MLVEYDIEKAIIDLVLAFVLFISVNRSAVFYIAKYHNTPGDFSRNPEHGVSNILVRILLPVVYLLILELLICFIGACTGSQFFDLRSIPIISFYWCIRLVLRKILQLERGPFWTQLIEAALSVVTAWYIEMFIVRQVQEKQFAVLDDSNVVFQIVLIVFIGLCQLAANGIAKRASQNAEENNFSDAESLKLEKKLYSYKKKYEACFSPRFKEDLCLQALFYAFALSEDSNRPRWRRKIERLLFPAGLIKTTGLMQIASEEKALSDKESVELSLPVIEKIWNKYLINTGCVLFSADDPHAFCFSDSVYLYDMAYLSDKTIQEVNVLYGHYCGTMSINIEALFRFSIDFVQKTKRFSKFKNEIIVVHNSLFKEIVNFRCLDLMCRTRYGIRPVNVPICPGFAIAIASCKDVETGLTSLRDFDEEGSLRLVRNSKGDYLEVEIQIQKSRFKSTKSRLNAKGWNVKYCGEVQAEKIEEPLG